jgi:hypothetical protein
MGNRFALVYAVYKIYTTYVYGINSIITTDYTDYTLRFVLKPNYMQVAIPNRDNINY